jgi:hypothetical protein
MCTRNESFRSIYDLSTSEAQEELKMDLSARLAKIRRTAISSSAAAALGVAGTGFGAGFWGKGANFELGLLGTCILGVAVMPGLYNSLKGMAHALADRFVYSKAFQKQSEIPETNKRPKGAILEYPIQVEIECCTGNVQDRKNPQRRLHVRLSDAFWAEQTVRRIKYTNRLIGGAFLGLLLIGSSAYQVGKVYRMTQNSPSAPLHGVASDVSTAER